ncbi:hypothetical protein [uncultured Parasphingorhabdus sp.]|uniref:hypothetical protein n=1 Tax=uncultured Parasphingorhabdus sp. TaxID=2709694 RepID=UPI0030DDBCA0|tara:strand:+ start:34327 stop:34536 length:210 start_codon:yes stop_codon:yes gene_type:complete
MGGTESVARFGESMANNVSGIYDKQGDTKASGTLFRSGINAQNWNNAGSFLDDIANGPGGIFKKMGLGF